MPRVTVDSTDQNELPDEYVPMLEAHMTRALESRAAGKPSPLIFDHKHENFEKVAKAISDTPAENLKERLLAYLMSENRTYISGFQHELLLTMAGFDFEKDEDIQVVEN